MATTIAKEAPQIAFADFAPIKSEGQWFLINGPCEECGKRNGPCECTDCPYKPEPGKSRVTYYFDEAVLAKIAEAILTGAMQAKTESGLKVPLIIRVETEAEALDAALDVLEYASGERCKLWKKAS